MKKKIEAIWDDVLLKLEQEHDISSAAINAWIKPLNIKEVKDDQIVLSLNSNFDARGIHFIESKMYDFYISLAIQDITGKKYEISFVLEEAKKKKAPASRTDTQLQDSNNFRRRNKQPDGSCRLHCCGRSSGGSLQSAFFIRRRRIGENPSDALNRPLHYGK